MPAWQMALAGCVAGGVGGIAGNPADIVLVRMIADGDVWVYFDNDAKVHAPYDALELARRLS